MEGFKYAAETAAAEHLKIAPTGTAHIALVKNGGGDQDKGLVVSHGDGGGGGNVLTATTAAAAGGGTDGPAATAAAALLRGGFLAAATAGDGPLIPRAHTLQPPMWCVGDAGRLHTGSLCPLSPKGDSVVPPVAEHVLGPCLVGVPGTQPGQGNERQSADLKAKNVGQGKGQGKGQVPKAVKADTAPRFILGGTHFPGGVQ